VSVQRALSLAATTCFWIAGGMALLASIAMGSALVMGGGEEWGYLALLAIVLAMPIGLLGVAFFWLDSRRGRD
jgi:hypothetical protein